MRNNFLQWAFFLCALAVALGAFGAHGLQPLLDEKSQHTYQTAVQYHFYHALALAVCGLLQLFRPNRLVVQAGRLFGVGLFLFCGSLYLMSFVKAAGVTTMGWLGAITPLGGLAFIAGWVVLLLAAARLQRPSE
ncbi:MAG TPA: DUF423 domain-containing protein [Lacibacter sp.]|nr:DUF423 domain-containing protein [Lacibacter sp.]HMO90367.1 DUF423 domain-containing protein [Lacibacter sp.]HMP87443.1 DUF423 domain-containing protein [Lacibacter sp.]